MSVRFNGTDKGKAINRFMKFLDQLPDSHSKAIRDVNEYEKVLWLKDVPRLPGCFSRSLGKEGNRESSDAWMWIQRRNEPLAPPVPEICESWLSYRPVNDKEKGPYLCDEQATLIDNPKWTGDDEEPPFIEEIKCLTDYPEVVEAWEDYLKNKWHPWVIQHDAWERIERIYARLLSIYQEQQSRGEEYELVLGLGLICWKVPSSRAICRHMVVADVHLNFEPSKNTIALVEDSNGSDLRIELDMLDGNVKLSFGIRRQLEELLDNAVGDPWDLYCMDTVFRYAARSMGEGDYLNDETHGAISERLTIYRAPALILRKRRTGGLLDTSGKIQGNIERNEVVSEQLADVETRKPPGMDTPLKDKREPREEYRDERRYSSQRFSKEQKQVDSEKESDSEREASENADTQTEKQEAESSTDTGKKRAFTFEIHATIGILSQTAGGWAKELNLVSWSGREPKYDLRSWAPDHSKMSKGVTLTIDELRRLRDLLNDIPL